MSAGYTEGEKILSYHGNLIYEAKILKVESRPDLASARPKPFYFIHYNGWKDRYNEWVDESRIMKWSDENLAKQATLKEELGPAEKSKKEKKNKGDKEKDKDKKGQKGTVKRKKREDGDDEVDSGQGPAKFELPIPKELQRRLYEDWEKITKQKMLVPLPRSPTVEEILDAFFKTLSPSGPNEKEIVDGIRGYFELALGTLLLYRFERVQFDAFARSGLTQVYGAEHLLRLLVKIPELLVHVEMDEEVREQLRQTLLQLLNFMVEKPHLVFSAQAYTPAPPNYIKQVES